MSPQKRRPQARKGRTAAAAAAKKGGNSRTWLIVTAVVVVVGIVLVVSFASAASKKHNTAQDDKPAPAALVSKVTGVPDSVITQVGQGTTTLPIRLPGPALKKDGKPLVVYIGAEYCPYCATERWAMVNALARFGTFTGLQTLTSAGPPEDPANISTFSFHTSKYTSPYIVFEPVETQTRNHEPLETPTAQQSALQAKWNVPPYVPSGNANSIPFIDFADSFLVSGASYDAGVLAGKSHDEIADAMQDPSTDIAKGAVGTANALTASICVVTDNQPAKACNNSAVQAIESALKKSK
jgi:hypothetical protein